MSLQHPNFCIAMGSNIIVNSKCRKPDVTSTCKIQNTNIVHDLHPTVPFPYYAISETKQQLCFRGADNLTLSRLTMHLLCVLTLAINISPNNGPIDLLPLEKMIPHVMAIHFAVYIMSVGPLLMKLQYL